MIKGTSATLGSLLLVGSLGLVGMAAAQGEGQTKVRCADDFDGRVFISNFPEYTEELERIDRNGDSRVCIMRVEGEGNVGITVTYRGEEYGLVVKDNNQPEPVLDN